MLRYPQDTEKKTKILESLSNLEYNEAFKVVAGWLTEEALRISTENNTIKDDITLRWSQGHFQLLEDFLNKTITARTLLEKLRNQTPSKGSA